MSRIHDTIRPVRYTSTALLVAVFGACSHTTEFSTDAGATDGGLDAQVEEDAGIIDADLSKNEAGQAQCGAGRVCRCSNGEDDDGDNQIDGFDNECTGPFDDDEGTFRVNDVREQSTPKCSDCFFDGNPGPGDDRCDVSSQCKEDGRPGQGGGNRCNTCTAATECVDRCGTVTPNGCDCFGCCEVLVPGGVVPIRLTATCRMDVIDNPTLCRRCVINQSCRNPCETCEICPGRTRAELPLTCMNAVECGDKKNCSSPSDCDFSQFCSQGCCVPILL